jgi:hypothetical protein
MVIPLESSGQQMNDSRSRVPTAIETRRGRMPMIPEQIEIATSVTIIPLGYRVRCTEPGCRNLGRMILRHADAGGRQIDDDEFCHSFRGRRGFVRFS